MSVHTAPGLYSRTLVIHIVPKIIIVSQIEHPIFIRQDYSDELVCIEAKTKRFDFTWSSNLIKKKRIRFSYVKNADRWSGAVALDVIDTIQLRVPRDGNEENWIVVDIKLQNDIIFVVFTHEKPLIPFYKIDNRSSST